MSFDSIKIVKGDDGEHIKIQSQTMKDVFYHITRVQEKCVDDTCQMVCDDCGDCAHEYHCTCSDFLLKSNICKHIHLLKRYRSTQEKEEHEEPVIVEQIPTTTQQVWF